MNKLYKESEGDYIDMIREYVTPDFDVTVYEIEDVITVSIGDGPADGGPADGPAWGN